MNSGKKIYEATSAGILFVDMMQVNTSVYMRFYINSVHFFDGKYTGYSIMTIPVSEGDIITVDTTLTTDNRAVCEFVPFK